MARGSFRTAGSNKTRGLSGPRVVFAFIVVAKLLRHRLKISDDILAFVFFFDAGELHLGALDHFLWIGNPFIHGGVVPGDAGSFQGTGKLISL